VISVVLTFFFFSIETINQLTGQEHNDEAPEIRQK